MLCVRAEDALAAAAAAAAGSDKMRSVTLSAPALCLLQFASTLRQVLESCSKFALLLSVCACAGAGRSRGRCGGWPAAAGGGRAARRARGAAARRRAALGLVLSSLTIKVPSRPEASLLPTVPHYLCDLSESVVPYDNFCAILVHRSRIFLAPRIPVRTRRVVLCILSCA
jgi:hypothetical protein